MFATDEGASDPLAVSDREEVLAAVEKPRNLKIPCQRLHHRSSPRDSYTRFLRFRDFFC